MKVEQIVCDVCGARQGAGIDGWWYLVTPDRFNLWKAVRGDKRPENPKLMDICSAQCATKKLNEFMMPEKNPMQERPQEKHYDEKESKVKVDEVHWSKVPGAIAKNLVMCTSCRGEGLIKVAVEKTNSLVVEQCEKCKGTGIEP